MRIQKLLAAATSMCLAATSLLGSAVFEVNAEETAKALLFEISSENSTNIEISTTSISAGDVVLPVQIYVLENPGVNGIQLKLQVNDGQVDEEGRFGNYGFHLSDAAFASPYCFDSKTGGSAEYALNATFNADTMNLGWMYSANAAAVADSVIEPGTTTWSKPEWVYDCAFAECNLVIPKDTPAGEYTFDVRKEEYINAISIGQKNTIKGKSSCTGKDGKLDFDTIPLTITIGEKADTTTTTSDTTVSETTTTVSATTTEVSESTTTKPGTSTTKVPGTTTTKVTDTTTTKPGTSTTKVSGTTTTKVTDTTTTKPATTTSKAPGTTTTKVSDTTTTKPATTTSKAATTTTTIGTTDTTKPATTTSKAATTTTTIGTTDTTKPATTTTKAATTTTTIGTTDTTKPATTTTKAATTTTTIGTTDTTKPATTTTTASDTTTTQSATTNTTNGTTDTTNASKIGQLTNDDSFYWNIADVCGKPGETVEVPIYVFGDPGTAGIQLAFDIDPALTLSAIDRGKAYKAEPTVNLNTEKPIFVLATNQGYNATAQDGSVLAKLIFQIPTDAKAGSVFSIDIASECMDNGTTFKTMVTDYNTKPLNITFYSGSITVVADEEPTLNYTSYTFSEEGQQVVLKMLNTDQAVAWSSSDESIATVNEFGLVTCKSIGSAVITATVNDKQYTCNISGNNSLFGDVDKSGFINTSDAVMILQHYGKALVGETFLTEEECAIADVNGDGKVTEVDATVILKYYSYNVVLNEPTSWFELTGNPNAPGAN